MSERHPSPVGSTSRGFERGEPEASAVRHEEELEVGTTTHEAGSVRARKHVDTQHVERVVPRDIEYSDGVEHLSPNAEDSGEVETLPDGSVSIPIFEEEIVITKRLVVRERVVLRKRTVTEEHLVEADVRQERIEIEADEGIDVAEGPASSGISGHSTEDESRGV